jgi:hypothetical protein
VRASAHSIHGASARFYPNKIVAQVVQLLFDLRLPGFADCYDADNRRDPDGDAQDRQHASHFIPKQRH